MKQTAHNQTMNTDHDGELNSPIQSTGESQRLPSLNALRCFETAARLEHFGQAADELHLTHGAISRAVRALEDDLGVALFERRSRRVFLTDAGRELAQSVRESMERMRGTCNRLRQHAADEQRLTLSCEPTLLMRWLMPRWPAFQRKLAKTHPQAQVLLVAGGGPFAFSSGIDLAIRRDDFAFPDAAHAHALFAEKVGPVCRPAQISQWFDKRGKLRANASLLHTRTRPQAWKAWARGSDHSIPASAGHQQHEHFYFSLQAAVAGLGVAIGPWHLVCDDLQSGLLAAPCGFVEDGSHYCLLSNAALEAGSIESLLLDWLRAQAKQQDLKPAS